MAQRYLIALGSNMRHHRHGPPERVLCAALEALDEAGIKVEQSAPVLRNEPLGPSRRRYANTAALVRTGLAPDDLLARLKAIERLFGRRSGGQRWAARVLDLDVVLWQGGVWASADLIVPHPRFRERDFVVAPAAAIAPVWRDPLSGITLRQLAFRLRRRRPLHSVA